MPSRDDDRPSPGELARPLRAPEREHALATAARRVTQVGLCDTEEALRKRSEREALVSGFAVLDSPLAKVLYDPTLTSLALTTVDAALRTAAERTNSRVMGGRELPPPLVIVYRSLEQLRSVSCVNKSAYGYYDGAIHLSGNLANGTSQIQETLLHEYTHHALVVMGLRLPMWLSEGLAIHLAREQWWTDPSLGLIPWLKSTHLAFESLVPAFMHTSGELYATHAYFQSLMMVEFVLERSGPEGLQALIASVGEGTTHVDDAFSAGAKLEGTEIESAWGEWVKGRWPGR